MVELQPTRLDAVFHALADPTRRAILRKLRDGEHSIGDLAAPFAMTFAASSKHIRVLEDAGLVRREIKGRTHVCRIEAAPLKAADTFLRDYEIFWSKRLDALEAALRRDDKIKAKRKRR